MNGGGTWTYDGEGRGGVCVCVCVCVCVNINEKYPCPRFLYTTLRFQLQKMLLGIMRILVEGSITEGYISY